MSEVMMPLDKILAVMHLCAMLTSLYHPIAAFLAQQDLREKPAMMLLELTHHALQLYVE